MESDDGQDVDSGFDDDFFDEDDDVSDEEGYFLDDEDESFSKSGDAVAIPGGVLILPDGDAGEELSFEEARNLTSTIRNAAQMLWVLIKRAHQGKAWHALGYGSWEKYVRAEFDMSRSRAYQILDQAQVITEIEAVVPDGTTVVLSEAAARDLKGVLNEVLPEIQEKTEGLTPDAAEEVLNSILSEQRAALKNVNDDGSEAVSYDDDDEGFAGEKSKSGGKNTGGGSSDGAGGAKIVDSFPTSRNDDLDGDDWVDDWDGGEEEDDAGSSVDPLANIDVQKLKDTADVAQSLYIAVVALADLPDDLEDAIRVMSEDRAESINEKLSSAQYKLSLFADVWRGKTEQ